jgi:FMN phosphatase YigB (HAD superfamily)
MKLTLLLDLDDTLLENDIFQFLPNYLDALGLHLARFAPPKKIAREVLSATEKSLVAQNVRETLADGFNSRFYPAIGIDKSTLEPEITNFYQNKFPELRFLTKPKRAAVELVDHALSEGHKIVIATNPLFPATAIHQRLIWANLSPQHYPFNLISSFETFHFAKPNPAFLAECLGRLGWPEQPAVMIGNSLSEDILPAMKLGLPCFLVDTDPPENIPAIPIQCDHGTLEQALTWLKNLPSDLPTANITQPDAILAVLKSTPAVLDTIARGLPQERWHLKSAVEEWCFTEIICHLRDADSEINLPRFDRILLENNAFIPAVNADSWTQTRAYCQENGREALDGFFAVRLALINRLEALSPSQWDFQANHAIFGPTSLLELTMFIARHDQTHIQQALRTIHETEAIVSA